MRQIQPGQRLMNSKDDSRLIRQLLVDRIKGKLRNGELVQLLSGISFTEEYSLYRCQDNEKAYQFIKGKIGVPRGVKRAMQDYPQDSLFPFDEAAAFCASKERITL